MKFEDALRQMMFGGLISYGYARDFQIHDNVAEFFADRGRDHILKIYSENRERYVATVRAVDAIPRFFDRVEVQMNKKEFPPLDGAAAFVTKLQNSPLGSVFPFCTNVPWP
jgi:hypothetical protein